MTNGKRAPAKKFLAGGVSAALWVNKIPTGDGREITTFSATVDRLYKNAKDEWQSSTSFRLNDIPKAIAVLMKAYDYMLSTPANDAAPKPQESTNGNGSIPPVIEEEVVG